MAKAKDRAEAMRVLADFDTMWTQHVEPALTPGTLSIVNGTNVVADQRYHNIDIRGDGIFSPGSIKGVCFLIADNLNITQGQIRTRHPLFIFARTLTGQTLKIPAQGDPGTNAAVGNDGSNGQVGANGAGGANGDDAALLHRSYPGQSGSDGMPGNRGGDAYVGSKGSTGGDGNDVRIMANRYSDWLGLNIDARGGVGGNGGNGGKGGLGGNGGAGGPGGKGGDSYGVFGADNGGGGGSGRDGGRGGDGGDGGDAGNGGNGGNIEIYNVAVGPGYFSTNVKGGKAGQPGVGGPGGSGGNGGINGRGGDGGRGGLFHNGGPDGSSGAPGHNGTPGKNGNPGNPGTTGADGTVAFFKEGPVTVANYALSIAQFLPTAQRQSLLELIAAAGGPEPP